MKGTEVSKREWRTVQVFLSPSMSGIFEVEIDVEDGSLRCNCMSFKSRNVCKHSRFVKGKMDVNGGHYAVLVPANVTEEDLEEANADPETFRSFVLKNGKIEVL